MNLFLDTNIFLDILFKREFVNYSKAIVRGITLGLFNGIILDITILNIDYISNKQNKNIKEFLFFLERNFTIIGANNILIKEALKMNYNDLEDNLQYICAKFVNSDCIVTNDKKFPILEIETLSSKDFYKKYLT